MPFLTAPSKAILPVSNQDINLGSSKGLLQKITSSFATTQPQISATTRAMDLPPAMLHEQGGSDYPSRCHYIFPLVMTVAIAATVAGVVVGLRK